MNAGTSHGAQDRKPVLGPEDLIRTIKVVCEKCGRKYRLDARYAGRHLKCRSCGEEVEVSAPVELRTRPAAEAPGLATVLFRKAVAILTGKSGRLPIRRGKWLSVRQSKVLRSIGTVALAVGLVAGAVHYWGTDDAKIRFGRAEGKEIAFRQIVELEEEIAATLTAVRSKDAVEDAADDVGSMIRRQNALWETLADWKMSGSLSDGELNLLRTRYRERYRKSGRAIGREQLRVARLNSDDSSLTEAMRGRSGDDSAARRIVLTGGQF